MPNLIDLVKEQMSDDILGQFGSILNLDKDKTTSTMGAFLPAILTSIASKGSSESGAASLLGLVNNNNLGESFLSNFAGSLGSDEGRNGLLNVGGILTSALLGSKQNSMIDKLATLTGLGQSKSGSLLKMIAPFAMSYVGKMVKNQGLDAMGLKNFMQVEKKNAMSALPMGFANFFEDEAEAVKSTVDKASSGGGFPKWIIPALIALALLFVLYRSCGNMNKDKEVQHTHEGHDHGDHTHGEKSIDGGALEPLDFRMDDKGNVVNAAGTILHRAEDLTLDKLGNLIDEKGVVIVPKELLEQFEINEAKANLPELGVDADGNLVDEDGNVLYKKGEYSEEDGYYVDSEGKRIGFFGKVGQAIGDVAEATADAFKDVFAGIFSKKDRVGSTYKLTKVEFNPEDHRLSYFSKPEFEALVNTLKEYPEAKIEFRVYTDDGDSDSENRKLSKLRANVIHDMAVTLGIDDKQAKFSGMGSEDAAKAANDDVEIFVEH